jgi:hypothetical protein
MNASTSLPVGRWPEALERGRVADAAFAAAYARTGDQQRAWIKTGLAAMYAAMGGPLPISRQRHDALGHDLLVAAVDEPLDYVLVACGRDFLSPARLSAVVTAALCARVPDVAAVRVGAAWPKPLLTALELCGVETAARISRRDLTGLLAELPTKSRGAVVILGDLALPAGTPPSLDVRRAAVAGKAGVFGSGFDAEALSFAHPDGTFYCHDGPCPELPGWLPGQGSLSEVGQADYDVVYVATSDALALAADAPLCLGPGREGFWLWPHLPPEAFRRRRFAAAVDPHRAADAPTPSPEDA